MISYYFMIDFNRKRKLTDDFTPAGDPFSWAREFRLFVAPHGRIRPRHGGSFCGGELSSSLLLYNIQDPTHNTPSSRSPDLHGHYPMRDAGDGRPPYRCSGGCYTVYILRRGVSRSWKRGESGSPTGSRPSREKGVAPVGIARSSRAAPGRHPPHVTVSNMRM